jgi:FAD/FMN-containing dehydrogenase
MTNVMPIPSAKLGPGGHWRNWVGNQSFVARHKAEPSSEDELAALVHEASRQNLPIRVAGSGHSFTPVVVTSGLLLSLKNMQGLVSADLDRKRVVVRAGTRMAISAALLMWIPRLRTISTS